MVRGLPVSGIAAGVAVVAVLAALPFVVSSGALFVIGLALVEGLFALSWNLLFTYTGIASFGHAAFFAAGAYFVGCAQRYGWPLGFPVQLLLGAALAGAAAFALGAAALRRVSGIGLPRYIIDPPEGTGKEDVATWAARRR